MTTTGKRGQKLDTVPRKIRISVFSETVIFETQRHAWYH
jgi:hypothetical protein